MDYIEKNFRKRLVTWTCHHQDECTSTLLNLWGGWVPTKAHGAHPLSIDINHSQGGFMDKLHAVCPALPRLLHAPEQGHSESYIISPTQ